MHFLLSEVHNNETQARYLRTPCASTNLDVLCMSSQYFHSQVNSESTGNNTLLPSFEHLFALEAIQLPRGRRTICSTWAKTHGCGVAQGRIADCHQVVSG